MKFHCDMCGECCRHLDLSPIYAELDRGDGVCKYLDGDICSIYDTRPIICRVKESYHAFFENQLPNELYIQLNQEICNKFKIIKNRER